MPDTYEDIKKVEERLSKLIQDSKKETIDLLKEVAARLGLNIKNVSGDLKTCKLRLSAIECRLVDFETHLDSIEKKELDLSDKFDEWQKEKEKDRLEPDTDKIDPCREWDAPYHQ